MSEPRSSLDFLVIGAQKSGTTSLWRYLREHPRLRIPETKEVPVFAVVRPSRADLAAGIARSFSDARPDSLLGTVTSTYMVGDVSGKTSSDVRAIAERIAAALPDVKLIALLRDPIERAISGYAMSFRRGREKRSIDEALSELLLPEQLERARLRPADPDSAVVAGEYGRALGVYRNLFPAEQLHVAFTEDLERDPGAVIDGVLGHLGLPAGFRPEGLGVRHFRGGRRKLMDPHAEQLLRRYFEEDILPHMSGDPAGHRAAFSFFLETWDVAPDPEPLRISAEVRSSLEAHYREDARKLEALGVAAPWIERWDAREAP